MRLFIYMENMNKAHQWEHVDPLVPLHSTRLEPLLTMGRGSYPFSFCAKGMPTRMSISDEVFSKWSDTNYPVSEGYLTLAQLIAKTAELMISPEKEALSSRKLLILLIKAMGDTPTNPKHQRIVYWGSHH